MSVHPVTTIAVQTANDDVPARRITIHARPRSTALARYRDPRPPAVPAGLTSREAAELERIRARLGRVGWRRRLDGRLLVVVFGDRPLASEAPLYLVMRADGTIALAVRPLTPPAPDDDR